MIYVSIYLSIQVGSEGFLKILPIYMEHLLSPTLTASQFATEVHHINGEGKDAAQDQSCLVPLAGGGEGIHQDALAVLHADVPQGRLFQFRIAFLELLDDAPDVRQRAGPAVAFGTQAFHRCRPEADRMVLVLDGVQPQGNDFPASVDSANFVTQGLLDFQYQPGCLNQSNGFTLQERGSNISQFIRFRCFSHIGSRVVTNTGLTKKAFLIVKREEDVSLHIRFFCFY